MRYYFDVHLGGQLFRDNEGKDFGSPDAARAMVEIADRQPCDVVLFADVVDGGNPRELLQKAAQQTCNGLIPELEQLSELLVG